MQLFAICDHLVIFEVWLGSALGLAWLSLGWLWAGLGLAGSWLCISRSPLWSSWYISLPSVYTFKEEYKKDKKDQGRPKPDLKNDQVVTDCKKLHSMSS